MNILIYDVDCISSGIRYPIKEALDKMGHNSVMFDWTLYFNNKSFPSILNKIKNKVLLRVVQKDINRDLKKIITKNKFDIFLVMRGDHIFPETLNFAKTKINKIVNWNTDDLFNNLNSSTLIKDSIELYDIHFSPRYHLKNEYLNKGAKSFEKLDWYYRYGLDYNMKTNSNIEYLHESTFIGSWSQRRENLLSSLNNEKLDIYGWGWNKKSKSTQYINWKYSPSISIVQMQKEFFRSKININILTIENRDTTNLRNFEIPASGGFQLSERSDEILQIFDEDKEIVCFSSREELKDKYEFYLKNNIIREKIALAGMNKLFDKNHSLIDRLEKIIKITNL